VGTYFDTVLESELFLEAAISDEQWLGLLKKSRVRYGPRTLGEFSDEELMHIISELRSIIPPEHKKFAPFYVYQIARGNLSIGKITEDSSRIVGTVDRFIKQSRKGGWEGSRNIYDYPDWKELERITQDKEEADYEQEQRVDSVIVHTEKYEDQNAAAIAAILGEQLEKVPYVQYWLRKIFTLEGAIKYGKGTIWCTTSTHPMYDEKPEKHPYNTTYKKGNLYIIEKATHDSPRRPILQISDRTNEVMNKSDGPVGRVGKKLTDFVNSVVPKVRQMGDDKMAHLLEQL
jgi:hypothetical protein